MNVFFNEFKFKFIFRYLLYILVGSVSDFCVVLDNSGWFCLRIRINVESICC